MRTAPCYNCEKRVIGCHSNCLEYICYDKERKKLLYKKRIENDRKYDFINYKADVFKRMSR